MAINKRILFFSLMSIVVCFGLVFSAYSYYWPKVRWQIIIREVRAAGNCPYEIGLLNTTAMPCTVSDSTCKGSQLCMTGPIAPPCLYSEISGQAAGGNGTNALYSQAMMAKAGYKPGDQIISCGMTMTQMENGVLATPNGCAGCTAKIEQGIFQRLAMIVDYIIAGKKE